MRAPTPPRFPLLVALLLAPLPAAALEKCVSAAGKVTYSEAPCPPGSKASTVRGTESPAPPATGGEAPGSASQGRAPQGKAAPQDKAAPAPQGPVANAARGTDTRKVTTGMGGLRAGGQVETRYYDVQGSDYDSLLAAIKAQGGPHGGTEWSLTYDYRIRRGGKACSIESLTTTLKQVMTLPRWTPPKGTSPKLFADWSRYVAGLRTHQEGHLEIGRDMQEALRDSLAVTTERCEKLDASVKAQFKVLLERHREREKKYDYETAQGRTQGVEFNAPGAGTAASR